MKILYKLSFLLFLLPIIVVAGNDKGKYTKSKKISKTFTVNKNCMVDIQNKFGSVTITTWDRPTVSIDIMVEVSGDNQKNVDAELKEIDVDFNATASMVSARTINDYSNTTSSSGSSLLSTWFSSTTTTSGSSNKKIDYIIKMPKTASLDLSNDYGAVILDRLEGHAKIKCDFGRLDIGQLLADNNLLSFDYTNNSHIDYMKSGTIRADFSGFELHGAEKVEYKGDYTKAKFEDVKNINFNGDFSTIQSDKVLKVVGRGDYSTIKLGTVLESVNLRTDFGSISIEELGHNFTDATIKSEYTGIKVGYHPEATFTFDIDTEFASIKLSEDLTTTKSDKGPTSKQKSGFCGSKNATSVLNIRSSFGGVNVKRN